MLREVLGEQGWTPTWWANGICVRRWRSISRPPAELADRQRLRAVVRLPRRRDQPVVSRTRCYDDHRWISRNRPRRVIDFGEDITDKAIEFIMDAKAVAPEKPFFLYYAPGACHAPHHARKEWIAQYRGQFDMGYEAMREQPSPGRSNGIIRRPPNSRRSTRWEQSRREPDLRDSRSRRWTSPGRGLPSRPAATSSRAWQRYTRLPRPRGPSDRPAAGLSRRHRSAREHADPPRLRQRGQWRGRPGRVGQRDEVLQWHP